jgi:hypothetical protein
MFVSTSSQGIQEASLVTPESKMASVNSWPGHQRTACSPASLFLPLVSAFDPVDVSSLNLTLPTLPTYLS